MLKNFGVKCVLEKGSFRRERENTIEQDCAQHGRRIERTVSSASLRKIASTPSSKPACFVVQDPPSSRDDSILFQKAPYLHSTVHLSCRMVSEDGRNYKFSPISAAKSPRFYRNRVDDELTSFGLRAESLAIYHQRQVDIMVTTPKP